MVQNSGIEYSLSPLTLSLQSNDLKEGLGLGNHKGVSNVNDFFVKMMQTEIESGFSLLLPLNASTQCKDGIITHHNIIEQNTITETREIVEKLRLTHNNSKTFRSSASVNGWVNKDALQDCMYGFCICRLVHYIISLCKHFQARRTYISIVDWKSDYRRAHLVW